MLKTGLKSYVYDFSVDYDAILVDDILDIPIIWWKKWHRITKCLGLLKSVFLTGVTFLSLLTRVNMLSCVSMNNRESKVRSQIINVSGDDPVFFLLVLKQINAVVVATIWIVHVQNCVFLMLYKT